MRRITNFMAVICSVISLCFGTTTTQAADYSENDVLLLARVINAEAGPACSIEHNQLVGCVVMNRVHDPRFPNTISGVVYQRGQYACVGTKNFNAYPSQVALNAARYVLSGKAYCPKDVVFQAEFRQGKGVYKVCKVNTKWYSSTTYFCYG